MNTPRRPSETDIDKAMDIHAINDRAVNEVMVPRYTLHELEATWGAWEDLQATYKDLVSGKITTEQAEAQIFANARQQAIDHPVDGVIGEAGPGRGHKRVSITYAFVGGEDWWRGSCAQASKRHWCREPSRHQ